MGPKNLNRLRRKLQREFYEAQFKTVHTQGIKTLQAVFEEYPFEDFLQEFIQCLKIPLTYGERQVSVERTLDFAAKFCVSFVPEIEEDDDASSDPLLKGIFQFVFKSHGVANEAIRFRVCQFANRLLASMTPTAGLEMELWNQLHSCMSERLKDKRPSVRVQAVKALQRLQDPSDEHCSVIKAMKYHLAKDPSAEVRLAVLSTIATKHDTLMDVVARTRDVSETVRRRAYEFLAEKVELRILSIRYREMLLKAGLNDRSESVCNFVKKTFLTKWLKSCNEKILTLLSSLDVTNWSDAGLLELVLKCLFEKFDIQNLICNIELDEETKTVTLDKLTPERALFWRYMAQYLDKMEPENSTDMVEKVLPNLSPLCEYIRSYFATWSEINVDKSWSENLERKFILKQLIEMTKLYDYSDETGRSHLKDLLVYLLLSPFVEVDLVPATVSTLVKVVARSDDFIDLISDVVDKIHCPAVSQKKCLPEWELRQRKIKKAKIRLEINTESERQENAVHDKDYMLAQSINENIVKLQTELEALTSFSVVEENVVKELNDPVTLIKCLEIILSMLQSAKVSKSTLTLTNLREDFVLKCVAVTDNLTVQSKSLEALALFCLVDVEIAKSNFVFFNSVLCGVKDDDVELSVSALKAIFDIIFLFGVESFDVTDRPDVFEDRNSEENTIRNHTESENSVPTDDLEYNGSTNIHELTRKGAKSVNLISILTSLLDHKYSKIRSITVEGLCKLLFTGKIVSPELLSRLVLLWYTPISDEEQENYLHQLMGTFFPTYTMHCEGAQEALASATLPALRTLTNAPPISPLANVDLLSVACFFLDLTRPGVSRVEPEINMHNHMGIAFCQEVFENEDNLCLQEILIRSLSLMDLSLNDPLQRQQYSSLCNKLKQFVSDKICLRYFKKFHAKILANKSNDDELEKSKDDLEKSKEDYLEKSKEDDLEKSKYDDLEKSKDDDLEKSKEKNEETGIPSDEDEIPQSIQMDLQRASMMIPFQNQAGGAGTLIQVVGPSDESDEDDFLETVKATVASETPSVRVSKSDDDFEINTPATSRKRKLVRRRR